jgi:tetratricopeptide (TPR) repeat protein
MTATDIKEKIAYYIDKDMIFSALILCEQLLKIDQTEYWQFRYADILRLCGYFSKSNEVYSQIEVSKIPVRHKYLYHLYLGSLHMDMGSSEKAKEEFQKYIALEECDTVAYIFLVSVLTMQENIDEAISYLEQALTKKGDIDEVYYNLANKFAMKGDFDKAVNAIENCLKIDPNYPNAMNWKNDFLERRNLRIKL